MNDPRHYQIAVLVSLLACGWFGLELPLNGWVMATYIGSSLAMQWVCTRAVGLRQFEPRSALISSLSLCLLLRTESLWLAAAGGIIGVAGKFFLRVNGKHVFNPSNLAVTVLSLGAEGAWLSPGQWGSAVWFAGLAAFLGILTAARSRRMDITLGFLGFYIGGLYARALWLGDPLSIPLHQMRSGTLLIFAFLMISDPKPTPDARLGRLLFAASVALLGLYLRFGLYVNNGLIYALAALSPLSPLIDRLLPGKPFDWRDRPS
ncbi:MAG: RnfABCDGE type electron transport complex subunit D [Methylococcaceae bacterium]|nr:RnfABCDGE type electron transport complex subunit D [Methylococcaceae bacterium]